jgi:hypothetical protein
MNGRKKGTEKKRQRSKRGYFALIIGYFVLIIPDFCKIPIKQNQKEKEKEKN